MTRKELMDILDSHIESRTTKQDIYEKIMNLLVQTPEPDLTIPEILADAANSIARTHGVAVEDVSFDWLKPRETGDKWPIAILQNLIFRGEPCQTE